MYFFTCSYESYAFHPNFIFVTASYSSQVDARSKHYLIETEDNEDETAEGKTESFETATLNILEGEGLKSSIEPILNKRLFDSMKYQPYWIELNQMQLELTQILYACEDFQGEPGDPLNPFQRSTGLPG